MVLLLGGRVLLVLYIVLYLRCLWFVKCSFFNNFFDVFLYYEGGGKERFFLVVFRELS